MTRNPVVVMVPILEDTVPKIMALIILEEGSTNHIDYW
jgi:hypothetical protein